MTYLSLSSVSFLLDSSLILDNISFDLEAGDWLAIAGRNGSGKSTLLRLIANIIQPSTGEIKLNGVRYIEVSNIPRKIAIMSQRSNVIGGMSVFELVKLGRYPHLTSFQFTLSKEDIQQVEYSIDFTGLNDLRDRCISTLSGGERQRAFLALALAQDGSLLLFDEPTNHLDIVAQYQILQLLKKLTHEGKTVVSVLHDLNHISKYSNKIALLKDGKLHAFGLISEQLTSRSLSSTYGIEINSYYHGNRLYVDF